MTKKTFHISTRILVGHLILILCQTPKISNGQQLFKITYGNLDTDSVSLTSFKLQKELVIHNGYKLDTALIYFQIPGESGILVVNYKPILDTINFYKCIDLLKPGAYVSFENIIISDSSNNKFTPHNRVYYLIIPDTLNPYKESELPAKIKRPQNLNYISGSIYFSGTNFPNVDVCRIYKNKTSFLTNAFEHYSIAKKIPWKMSLTQPMATKFLVH